MKMTKPNIRYTFDAVLPDGFRYRAIASTPWGDCDVVSIYDKHTRQQVRIFQKIAEIAIYRFLAQSVNKRFRHTNVRFYVKSDLAKMGVKEKTWRKYDKETK